MNDTKFSFSGLVKLNIERPVLGTNPSYLKFIKHMSLDLSSKKLYRVFVTLFELVKPKRCTHRSWWGKWEGNHFANNCSCLSLPLNMALVYTSCQSIGYSADLRDDPLHESCHSFESFKRMHCPLSHCVFVPSSHAAKSFCRAARCSKEVRSLPLQLKQPLC